MAGDIPLPPKPVLTRWGTWINAVQYHNENFTKIAIVIENLDSSSSSSIKVVQELVKKHKSRIKDEIHDISDKYGFLPGFIQQLENQKLSLTEGFEIIEKKNLNSVQLSHNSHLNHLN